MQLFIKHENLIDSSYEPEEPRYQSLFSFDDAKVNNLVSEILYGSPTCYLVSGYRGSGKTSFIQRVKQRCIEENGMHPQFKAVLFVYSSFSRYDGKTNFLRKIIRDFQETIMRYGSGQQSPVQQELKVLYEKTFYDVKTEWSQVREKEKSTEIALDVKQFLAKLFAAIFPILLPFFLEVIMKPLLSFIKWTELPAVQVVKGLLYILLVVWGAFRAISFNAKYSIKTQTSDKFTETSLSDDDITEYQLERILNKFVNEKYKLVFVLDELDKIEQSELDLLLKEMKPWLVRGKVDFILVSGQKLTMQYYQLREGDDEILASLFSKIVHVNQMSDQQLIRLFRESLFMGAQDDHGQVISWDLLDAGRRQQVDDLCNSLIYRSKCIPRTFMNLLRQDLQWQNGKASMLVQDQHFQLEKLKMGILKKMFDGLAVNADIPETVRGHLVMQLFRVAVLVTETNRGAMTAGDLRSYILEPNGKGDDGGSYQYLAVVPLIKECIDLFFNEAVKAGLINQAIPGNAGSEAGSDKDAWKESVNDFIVFAEHSLRITQFLFPDVQFRPDIAPIKDVLGFLVAKNAISIRDLDTELLVKSARFYTDNQKDPIYRELKEWLDKQNISLPFLYQQLLGFFLQIQLQQVFGNDVEWFFNIPAGADIPAADFTVRFRFSDTQILVDYKFINGSVAITQDEVSKAISLLEEYNLESGRGNYYLSVIFYKNVGGPTNEESLNLAANLLVEKIRPDLKRRIRFIILYIDFFGNLVNMLNQFKSSVEPYTLAPTLKPESGPKKSRGRKISLQENIGDRDLDDPQKGRWGGKEEANGRKLSAFVGNDPDNEDRYPILLRVESTNPDNPLTGRVTFYLHDMYSPDKITVVARDNAAELKDLPARGAFTVGATCDNSTTMLELDLSTLPGLPQHFEDGNP